MVFEIEIVHGIISLIIAVKRGLLGCILVNSATYIKTDVSGSCAITYKEKW